MTIPMIPVSVFGGSGPLICDAADFDGTNDWLSRTTAFTGGSSSTKTGIFSCWIYSDISIITEVVFDVGNAAVDYRMQVVWSTSDKIQINVSPDGGTTIALAMETSSALSTGSWHHILASWDCATTSRYLYIDGISNISVTSQTDTAVDYSALDDDEVGAIGSGAGSFKFNGGIAEVYFAPAQFLNLSSASNRGKFRTTAGKPAFIGTTGELPTGVTPMVYLHLDNGEAAANFATNRAGAGNYTVNGTLTTFGSSPSD